jgi:Zn-dependent protease
VEFLSKIDLGSVLVQYTVLLFSLCFHEAAHAWMADLKGDYTARYLGRVSLNPIVHIDPVGTVLFPLLQFFSPVPVIGWAKPVPVNPAHLRNPRRDHMWIAAAGPLSNLLLAVCCMILLIAAKFLIPDAQQTLEQIYMRVGLPSEPSLMTPLLAMLFFGVLINMGLAFFNLIPIPPLDGNWILSGILPYRAAQALDSLQPYGFIILYGLMFLGLFRFLFYPISMLIFAIVFI